MTADLIARSQAGNQNATLKLIQKFNPLLKKYAGKLYRDDAYDDLLVDFIELLHDIQLKRVHSKAEGCLVAYINKAVRGFYLKESEAGKKRRNLILDSNLDEAQRYYLEAHSASCDTYFRLELPGVDRILTKPETAIIKMVYIMGYTVSESAGILGTSRQAANQMKKRALAKLKAQYMDKPVKRGESHGTGG